MGSGRGSVGRAVVSDTRYPWSLSSHRQTFVDHLVTVNCVEKTKIKEKEAVNGPFLKDLITSFISILGLWYVRIK